MVTVRTLYELAKASLAQCADDAAAFEADCLCEDILMINRTQRLIAPETEIPEDRERRFRDAVSRRKNGYPLQYILGRWEFSGFPFKVGEGVLIPRPETEILVDAVYQRMQHRCSKRIADLCAGSGAIAVSLRKLLPDSKVFAVEISGDAMPYLSENCRMNGADVTIIRGDVCDGRILQNFADPDSPGDYIKLDCIVSNPPYVTSKEMTELQKEVTFEPKTALDGGTDGLNFYRIITMLWKGLLSDNGIMAFECGAGQADAVSGIMTQAGFVNVDTICDLAGIRRVVVGING